MDADSDSDSDYGEVPAAESRIETSKQDVYELMTLSNTFSLFVNDVSNDVNLRVQDRVFPAHKCFLSQKSKYFEALFTGNFSEKEQDEIELKGINADHFQTFLGCLHGVFCDIRSYQPDDILGVLVLSRFFLVEEMTDILTTVLLERVGNYLTNSIQDFVSLFETAVSHSLTKILDKCVEVLTKNSLALVRSEHLASMSSDALRALLSLDNLNLPELEVFGAVRRWLDANPDSDSRREVLSVVRLTRISDKELARVVWPTKLYEADELLQLISSRSDPNFVRQERVSRIVGQNLFPKLRPHVKAYSDPSKLPEVFHPHLPYGFQMATIVSADLRLCCMNAVWLRLWSNGYFCTDKVLIHCSAVRLEWKNFGKAKWCHMTLFEDGIGSVARLWHDFPEQIVKHVKVVILSSSKKKSFQSIVCSLID